MKKLFVLFVAVALLSVGITGCNTSSSDDDDTATGTLQIVNNLGYTVTNVWVKEYQTTLPASSSDAGSNKLATTETIATGSSKSFSLDTGDYMVSICYHDTTAGKYYWYVLETSDRTTPWKFTVADGKTIGATLNTSSWSDFSVHGVGTVSIPNGELKILQK